MMGYFAKAAFIVFFFSLLLAGVYFIPWQNVSWGQLKLSPTRTITVYGMAKSQQKNEIASFSAGVEAVNDNKDEAVNLVNNQVELIIQAVKKFGISAKDIKTQSLNINQRQETYYEDGRQKQRPGQWSANNTITITLRNIDRASDLANILSSSGATHVYGPNFHTDTTNNSTQNNLIKLALKDALEKAKLIANAEGFHIWKVISITEGSQPRSYGIGYEAMAGGGGGGPPLEPGTNTTSKTVTVVFEVK